MDLILLGSSIQILPTHKLVEESWSAFPVARQRLLQLLASSAAPVVLLSGDVHMAEASRAACTATTADRTRYHRLDCILLLQYALHNLPGSSLLLFGFGFLVKISVLHRNTPNSFFHTVYKQYFK